MLTLKSQLLHTLRKDGDYMNGAILERMEFPQKKGIYKPSTIGRTLRLMAEEDERIETTFQGKSIAYRYIKNAYELFDKQQR